MPKISATGYANKSCKATIWTALPELLQGGVHRIQPSELYVNENT
ncbi:hypothetical protein FHS14_001398 [Paenibacillus baekrokdamisoli]|nr:hypothetical protein [Paenibacillus baekrokdamisoli]MBB3068422.1 hypothetical protein [Paenibacillus baekrokdamisoli]